MQLDFTALNRIADPGSSTTGAAERAEDSAQGGGLQREADHRAATLSRAADVYKVYQDNIKATELLQAQILKGVKAGEDIYSLFLKAVKALSLTVKDDLLFTQVAKELPQHYPEAAEKLNNKS